MHEMAIVQSIMDIIEEQARLHKAEKVVAVSLEFGMLTAVVPQSIEFSFEVLSKGRIAEGARLDITIVPLKVFCLDCSKEYELENYQPFCPVCSSASLQIVAGRDEMRIVSLEVDGFAQE